VSAAAIIATLLVSMLTIPPVFAQHIDASLRIDPPEIAVRLFYSGTQIRVTGVSRVGKDLFLLCTGEEKTVELKEKKRIWNMLWVNADDIAFKNVPSFYQLLSSGKLSRSPMEPDWIRAGIGFQALENRVVSGADEERQRRCFSELVKLKQREGLYSIQEGGLEIHPLGDEWNEFSGSFNFPSDASPGVYRFRLIGLVDGKAVDLASGQISVRLAGSAAFIRSLSMEHGLIYGIFSVVIALIAGLLTGIIFARRSRKLRH
jgi:hypothetical protein